MHRRLSGVVPLLLASLFVAACKTYEALPNADWPRIEHGDRLRVTTRSGAIYELQVEAADERSLRGEDVELPLADVVFIEQDAPFFTAARCIGLILAGFIAWAVFAPGNFLS